MLSSGSHVHNHSHTVTKCLYENRSVKKASTGAAASTGEVVAQSQNQESLTLRETLTDKLQGWIQKADRWWGQVWNGDSQESKALWQSEQGGVGLHHSIIGSTIQAEAAATGILASSAWKQEEKTDSTQEERSERRVQATEGGISQGLKRGQERNLHKGKSFWQQSRRVAERIQLLWGKEKKEEPLLSENPAEPKVESNSYLLDSYNRLGEYSTLSKDHSLEASFRVRG